MSLCHIWTIFTVFLTFLNGSFPCSSVGKESPCNAGNPRSIPRSGRSPGKGNGNPLQYSYLENPKDRGAWWATVHGVARVGHDLATKPPPPHIPWFVLERLFRQLLMWKKKKKKCTVLSQFFWKNSLLSKQPGYYLFKFLVLAVLGLRCCAAFFSHCGVQASDCGGFSCYRA